MSSKKHVQKFSSFLWVHIIFLQMFFYVIKVYQYTQFHVFVSIKFSFFPPASMLDRFQGLNGFVRLQDNSVYFWRVLSINMIYFQAFNRPWIKICYAVQKYTIYRNFKYTFHFLRSVEFYHSKFMTRGNIRGFTEEKTVVTITSNSKFKNKWNFFNFWKFYEISVSNLFLSEFYFCLPWR